jgi:hypothetical protein
MIQIRLASLALGIVLLVNTTAFADPWLPDARERGGIVRGAGSETCQSRLDNHAYFCKVKSSFDTEFTDIFAFTTPGVQSLHFDLAVAGIPGTPFGCACVPTGSFAAPAFDESFVFQCVGPQITFRGEATADAKIKHAEGLTGFGDTFAIKCRQM